MKKIKWLSYLLVFALVLTLTGPFSSASAAQQKDQKVLDDGRVQLTFEFKDMKEAEWAAAYIAKMKSKNVLSGYEDGTYRPNAPVKRVEAIVTAVRLMGKEAEAKAKAVDAKLNFKDAEFIQKKYAWAKGYILVALENGLFDASEDKLQPEKPASRVWISSLLVRALGYSDEALKQMTTTPEFKDAGQIPAGSVGYVNVALEQGLVSGYPDGTFKPNKGVTRAELAVLLDKTSDGLQENEGAITVTGIVKAVVFPNTDSTILGQLTVVSANNETITYGISADLLIQSGKSFIRADQLKLNDAIIVVVKDNKVIEATLLDEQIVKDELAKGVRELNLKVEADEIAIELKYKNRKGKIELSAYEGEGKSKSKLNREDAEKLLASVIEKSGLSDEMTDLVAVERVISALEITSDELEKLKLVVKFSNGKSLFVEIGDAEDRKKK